MLLLTTGIILGGIWAHFSWGRFWGWDPKETWALIALMCYVVPLHGRLVGWLKDFGMAVTSVVAFNAVLMAWYGVNFVLGTGLHSYGFASGGSTSVVAGFVVLDLVCSSMLASMLDIKDGLILLKSTPGELNNYRFSSLTDSSKTCRAKVVLFNPAIGRDGYNIANVFFYRS